VKPFLEILAVASLASSVACSHQGPTPVAEQHHADRSASQNNVDASTNHSNANPCHANPCSTAARPPARLPDGGVNPEACVGVCSRVQHNATEVDAGAPDGTIDLASVDRTLRREARVLRECYDGAVINHPWLGGQGGTVNVHFVVDPNGRVRGAPVATGIDAVPDVASCIARRIRYIVFPVPAGGAAEIALPFTFDPES
jgi:hypothetical protein